MACNFFDIALEVYMVKVSYQQKPYRRIITLAPESASRVQVWRALGRRPLGPTPATTPTPARDRKSVV